MRSKFFLFPLSHPSHPPHCPSVCKNETFSSRALSARVATHNLRVVNESDGLAEEVRRLASEITKAKAALPAGEWNGKNGGAGGKERRKRSGNGGGGGGVGGRSDEGEGDDDGRESEGEDEV